MKLRSLAGNGHVWEGCPYPLRVSTHSGISVSHLCSVNIPCITERPPATDQQPQIYGPSRHESQIDKICLATKSCTHIIRDCADEHPKSHLEAHVEGWGRILGPRAAHYSRISFLKDGKGRAMVMDVRVRRETPERLKRAPHTCEFLSSRPHPRMQARPKAA